MTDKVYAADGRTECQVIEGLGFYVSAVEFNKLFARAIELESALSDMHTFFQPNAWGSEDNKRDALRSAEQALAITQEKRE
ncbi:hypothetical protein [Comamonas odontotermitis]|uniref:hypothetical protein n=1 Tax=Comamonas odontotermitis TaxID=379895 RepID=UPI001CC40031|nr:hypothetical protein [Comamonas odontotermitis]UBB18314.1 hypothetical protein LAD35_06665 [Comamonas odontotermitis]